jgi:hypothetical protein
MATDTPGYDDQDQAELFDEENLDASETGGPGPEYRTFEENPDVLDVITAVGDARQSDLLDEADFNLDAIDDEDLEDGDPEAGDLDLAPDADAYDETDEEDAPDLDAADGVTRPRRSDVGLKYEPDVDRATGAQASAAHFESRGELSEADLTELGYANKPKDKR